MSEAVDRREPILLVVMGMRVSKEGKRFYPYQPVTEEELREMREPDAEALALRRPLCALPVGTIISATKITAPDGNVSVSMIGVQQKGTYWDDEAIRSYEENDSAAALLVEGMRIERAAKRQRLDLLERSLKTARSMYQSARTPELRRTLLAYVLAFITEPEKHR